MEKNYRKNQDKDPGIVNNLELKNMTTSARIDHFYVSPPIGPSLEWLAEIFQLGNEDKILFIRFEDFTADPETEMKRIYTYLELPYYKHDFDNLEQLTHENDVIHGIFGDHKIQNKIKPIKPDFVSVLGQDQSIRLREHYDWYFRKFNYI
jgi:sulfotransferase